MTTDRELKKAIEEMRQGSKNGFVVFFNKTFQFSCLWAAKIMSDTVRRDDFLSDFYPYALLHISDLKDDNDVFFWLEKLLPVFYEVWSGAAYADIIRPAHPDLPDDSAIRASASIVWSQIVRRVEFPKEPKKARIPIGFVIAGFASVALLLICVLIYQQRHIETADREMIDRINEENRVYSTDTELDKYLNGTYTVETENTTIEVEEIIHEPATE